MERVESDAEPASDDGGENGLISSLDIEARSLRDMEVGLLKAQSGAFAIRAWTNHTSTDNAFSGEAAARKQTISPLAGRADMLLFLDIALLVAHRKRSIPR
jgi:hypothetical protein